MAMNLSFFFLLLYFILTTSWCSVEGSCPEETCFSANRESCEYSTNQCGQCFQGFIEVDKECRAAESNSNDDGWENDLEGTDGSDLTTVFDRTNGEEPTNGRTTRTLPVTTTPSSDLTTPSAPATGVDENQAGSNGQNTNLKGNVAVESSEELARKSHKSASGIEKIKASKNINKKSDSRKDDNKRNHKPQNLDKTDEKDGLKVQAKQKKREDEEKLNKFLSKTQKKSSESEKSAKLQEKIHLDVKLDVNSTQNPPPFISKHKVGKSEEARASELDDIYFLFIVIGCSVAGIAGLALAGYCWYKLHTTAKAVSEAEYSGYGMKGSTKRTSITHGDEKLDYSAEMYHYHQTKSQLAAMERAGGSRSSKQGSIGDEENSDEGDEGDYTVYECPGLAPTGDMTVVNPLFSDQEILGSDQDANGNRSEQSSPAVSRHSSTTKPE